jgi:chemotaxis protein histidine kinase CheA
MNGTITVDSTLGKGSTFTVQIPVTNEAIKTKEIKTTVYKPIKTLLPVTNQDLLFNENTSKLPLVLIIEDNIDVAHYLKTCLKEKYHVIHALNGDIGLQMAFENIPDIIISDL